MARTAKQTRVVGARIARAAGELRDAGAAAARPAQLREVAHQHVPLRGEERHIDEARDQRLEPCRRVDDLDVVDARAPSLDGSVDEARLVAVDQQQPGMAQSRRHCVGRRARLARPARARGSGRVKPLTARPRRPTWSTPTRDILISTDEVAARLGSDDLHLIEVDEDTAAYERGHIPGALALHWRDELQSHDSRDVVAKEGFEALMGARGIDENTEVVLYGGNNNWFAAYGYWYFKLYGHENVRLMDGGRKKWELEQRPLTTDVPTPKQTTYTAKPVNKAIRALRDEVIASVHKTPMVDVRSPEEYSGALAAPAHLPQEQAQRSGHIPGALNIPWSRAANEDGTFKSADELRALYLEFGQAERGRRTDRVLPHR